MNTKTMKTTNKIAIIAADKAGPDYGAGSTEFEARTKAARWGFDPTIYVAVEITTESYERIIARDFSRGIEIAK